MYITINSRPADPSGTDYGAGASYIQGTKPNPGGDLEMWNVQPCEGRTRERTITVTPPVEQAAA